MFSNDCLKFYYAYVSFGLNVSFFWGGLFGFVWNFFDLFGTLRILLELVFDYLRLFFTFWIGFVWICLGFCGFVYFFIFFKLI